MEKKRKILELRERLDKTLALPDLANEESVKLLVENQLRRSSFSHVKASDFEEIVGKRTKEVSNFVEMLRSASENEQNKSHELHADWKIKQDTDQLRVMYREGPHGTPFHTLLSEGYADGPIDVCLCVSWETSLYRKWWPQYKLPTFKIIMSECLHKVRVGEEISLVRVKVPWPVSDREALLHYFEIEYLKEDLILVLINTISDTERIEVSNEDLSRIKAPEAIRIDLVGGFVLQKIDHSRSYFRVIANMDIKLDFVPPSLINFISRQLIGSAHKLYQKAVSTVATSDEDYKKALEGPMYARIRENKTKAYLVGLDEEKMGQNATEIQAVRDETSVTEIVEEDIEQTTHSDQVNDSHVAKLIPDQGDLVQENSYISPEVEAALGILDNAIAILRKCGPSNPQINGPWASEVFSSMSNRESPSKEKKLDVLSSETVDLSSSDGKPMEGTPAMTKPPFMESMNKVCDEGSLKANGFHNKVPPSDNSKHAKGRKKCLCCVSF
ncbi:uncharacterized protein LOC141833465 isoform X1 [Curcuma longa]|uniref:uncharacterized protein LOC141833465 isoform X1 n=1 Tax=Curcuma longa TaxID=136217 RepID=UPI003D9E03B9